METEGLPVSGRSGRAAVTGLRVAVSAVLRALNRHSSLLQEGDRGATGCGTSEVLVVGGCARVLSELSPGELGL